MVRLWSVDKGVLRDNCGSSPGHWPPSSSVVWPAGQTSGLSLTTTRPQVRALPRPPWPRSGALGVQPHGGEVGAEGPGGCTPAVDSGGPPEREVLSDQWDQGGIAYDPRVDLGPADPDVGDGAGPAGASQEPGTQAPRGVDRQPPGPCRVGPERGDLGRHCARSRATAATTTARPSRSPAGSFGAGRVRAAGRPRAGARCPWGARAGSTAAGTVWTGPGRASPPRPGEALLLLR
jgi:hypothetical protein